MAYVTFNKNLEKANIISIGDNHSAVDGKLYFAKDDPSIYLGKEDGTVELKASATEIANGFVDNPDMALSAAKGYELKNSVDSKTNKPDGQKGNATTPIYIDANGIFQECDTYSSSYRIVFNGATVAPDPDNPLSFYAPTTVGSAGDYLRSNGGGAPEWAAFPTIPTIKLNGTQSTAPDFYAPTDIQSATNKCPYWTGSGWGWITPGSSTGGTPVHHEGLDSVDTALYINSGSSSVGTNEYVIYAPKTKGTAGQVVMWPNGSNIPEWQTLPSSLITSLNGGSTASGIYAPTSAGTQGQVLVSGGNQQAPTWFNFTLPNYNLPSSIGQTGEVMMVSNNSVVWGDATDILPSGATDGQYLQYANNGLQWADVQSGGATPAIVVSLADWTTSGTTSSYTIDPGKFYIFDSLPYTQFLSIQLDADVNKLVDNAVNEYSFSIPSNSTNLMFSVINSSATITWCSSISPGSDAEYSVYIYKINGAVRPVARGVFRTWQ